MGLLLLFATEFEDEPEVDYVARFGDTSGLVAVPMSAGLSAVAASTGAVVSPRVSGLVAVEVSSGLAVADVASGASATGASTGLTAVEVEEALT